MTTRVSLAEVAAADIALRPAEAVAVVAELCRQHARGEIPGIPSSSLIRVTREGEVIAQGPITAEGAGIARAGQLLDDLLPDADAPAEYRASGGLRLVIARALGTLDLPPYSSLDEFRAALLRFAGPDPVATMRGLFQRWGQPVTVLVSSGPHAMARIGAPVPSRDRSRPFSSALALGVAALIALGTVGIFVGSAQLDRPARAGAPEANRLTPQAPVAEPQRPVPVGKARTVASSAPMPVASAARASAARPHARRVPQPRSAAIREPRRGGVLEPRRGAIREPRREAVREPRREVVPEAAPEPLAEVAPEPPREAARRPSFFKRELFRIKIK